MPKREANWSEHYSSSYYFGIIGFPAFPQPLGFTDDNGDNFDHFTRKRVFDKCCQSCPRCRLLSFSSRSAKAWAFRQRKHPFAFSPGWTVKTVDIIGQVCQHLSPFSLGRTQMLPCFLAHHSHLFRQPKTACRPNAYRSSFSILTSCTPQDEVVKGNKVREKYTKFHEKTISTLFR